MWEKTIMQWEEESSDWQVDSIQDSLPYYMDMECDENEHS